MPKGPDTATFLTEHERFIAYERIQREHKEVSSIFFLFTSSVVFIIVKTPLTSVITAIRRKSHRRRCCARPPQHLQHPHGPRLLFLQRSTSSSPSSLSKLTSTPGHRPILLPLPPNHPPRSRLELNQSATPHRPALRYRLPLVHLRFVGLGPHQKTRPPHHHPRLHRHAGLHHPHHHRPAAIKHQIHGGVLLRDRGFPDWPVLSRVGVE